MDQRRPLPGTKLIYVLLVLYRKNIYQKNQKHQQKKKDQNHNHPKKQVGKKKVEKAGLHEMEHERLQELFQLITVVVVARVVVKTIWRRTILNRPRMKTKKKKKKTKKRCINIVEIVEKIVVDVIIAGKVVIFVNIVVRIKIEMIPLIQAAVVVNDHTTTTKKMKTKKKNDKLKEEDYEEG